MVEVAPLQLLATLAAEAPAIPAALAQRIARGTDIWISRVSDLISRVQMESGTATGAAVFSEKTLGQDIFL